MNPDEKKQNTNEPLRIQLGSDVEDEDQYDDDEVEVIRPHARQTRTDDTRGRGLHDLEVAVDDEVLPPSKTKIKKQMHELRDLGKELTELSKDQLAQLDIPDGLRDAVREMKNINKFGAQRRQIQYIGKLMREVDPAPIIARLDGWKGKSQPHIAYAHTLERWRERLLESDQALTDLLAAHPGCDVQRLRALIRNTHKEKAANRPPRSFREIYQALREIIPEPV